MQVSATSVSNYSPVRNAALSSISGRAPTAVTRRNEEPGDYIQRNDDPAVERKLSRVRDVQFAFSLALRTSQALESKFLFDPIV